MFPGSVLAIGIASSPADQACVKVEQPPLSQSSTSQSSTSQSDRKSFSSLWASLVSSSSAQGRDPMPAACDSPIDVEFDKYFANPKPHDMSYRARQEINPFLEAKRLGDFRELRNPPTMPLKSSLSPVKRKLSDLDACDRARVSEASDKFLKTSHQSYLSSWATMSMSSSRVVRQKVSKSD